MADMNTAQKVELVLDGGAINRTLANFVASNDTVTCAGGTSKGIVIANHAGEVDVTVTYGTRTGSIHLVVEDAPIIVTLGTPTPK